MHRQGHQRVGECLGFKNIFHTTTTAADGVEHQSPVKSKNGKWNNWFSQAIKQIFQHKSRESLTGGRKTFLSNLAMQFQSLSVEIKYCYGDELQAQLKNRPKRFSN